MPENQPIIIEQKKRVRIYEHHFFLIQIIEAVKLLSQLKLLKNSISEKWCWIYPNGINCQHSDFCHFSRGMLGSFGIVTKAAKTAREKTVLSSLSTNYLEVVRNMPYSQVGTFQGNPHGILPDQPNAISQTINGIDYKIYYKVNYIHDPADSATGTPGLQTGKNEYFKYLNLPDNRFYNHRSAQRA